MANHQGVNGLQHRPQDRYRATLAELKARGAAGGKTSASRRHSSAKWRAVGKAIEACKAGRGPSWDVLADFYDLAYAAGYGAQYNAARRKAKGEAAA